MSSLKGDPLSQTLALGSHIHMLTASKYLHLGSHVKILLVDTAHTPHLVSHVHGLQGDYTLLKLVPVFTYPQSLL